MAFFLPNYAVYYGYAASESEGSLELFSLGRFLKLDLYATASSSTSSGALRRLLTLCASGHTRKVLGDLEEGVLFLGLCHAQGRAEGLSFLLNSTRAPTRRLEGSVTQSTKRPRKRQIWRWIGNEESPRCTGVTPQRPSTPAQPPPHCNSTALRVVTGVCLSFPVVGFFQVVGLVGRSVAQSVEATPKGSKDRGEWSQRLQEQSPKTSQRLERQSQKVQSTWPAESGWTIEGFRHFVHKVQSTWPVQ